MDFALDVLAGAHEGPMISPYVQVHVFGDLHYVALLHDVEFHGQAVKCV